ncbi:BREX system ATP-binding domain-containing protein [Streptomyces sp. NPDC001532]|uniref:ATP-binding protein n=1 Tax=Streptomyces sp. NPDC001532 TaxID=3154520 RepID=UPI0033235D6E
MPTADSKELVGRHRETAVLLRALDEASAPDGTGSGSAALLRGEAGIGKTALLDWTDRRARERGFTVLRAVGSEAEAELAFGALHQVLRPLMARSDALPARQRQALEAALGLHETPSPDGGFLVGAAALTLLAEAMRDRPLLVLLDDLQWVDSSSSEVFAFLYRRTTRLPLVVVSAGRPDGTAVDGWPTRPVEVAALGRGEAALLLRRTHPALGESAAERVLREAAGNPLALLELPLRLGPEQVSGVAPLPEQFALGPRLERLFADRLAALPAAAERVLLLVALGGGTAAWDVGRWLRGSGAGRVEDVLHPIEASGLARLDAVGRLVFRHPLVRSAVVARASGERQCAAHRELAAALPVDDPRRLVHEAAAGQGPDEELAARLERAGRRLSRRGGDAEAASLLDRAAALSADPLARARRLTWAAVMGARGGRLPYTAKLLDELKRGPVPSDVAPLFAYATVYVDQSHRIDFESSFTLLPGVLDALADTGAEAFGGLAEQAFFKLLLASVYTDDPRGWAALAAHRERMSPLARLCLRAWSDPARTAHGVGDELRATVRELDGQQEAGAAWLLLWTAASVDMADATMWRRFTEQHAYATQGTIAKAKGYQDYVEGRWEQADVCRREAAAADALGYHCNALMFRHHHAHFLAGRGDEAGLRAVEERIGPVARRARMTFVTDHLAHLRGLAALAHGRAEDAYARFAALTPPGVLPPGLPWFHLPFFDFVDAAARTGRYPQARAHVAAARAARMADISPHHAFLLAAASALAATDEDAEPRFRAAYAVPEAERWVFEAARLRLAHGAWLRRHQRPGARQVLGEAHRAFRSLRAAPWAAQAEEELRAAGHAVAGPAGRRGLLTAQELRIAHLAADGLTNKDIGRLLRLSPRTVADHLYKVFPKLGITSRAALARALRDE